MAPHQQQPAKIPIIFRAFFLYIEPISTLVGAYAAAAQPQLYLNLTHAPSAPLGGIPISTSIVLTQLANLYLAFTINEALVLRVTDDLQVWCALLLGLLVADLGHLYSVHAVGHRVYWDVMGWNAIDWGNVAFVYVGATMRMAFLYLAWTTNFAPTTPRRSTRARTPKKK